MENYFEIAIKEALTSSKQGDVPIGAVIVQNGLIIAQAHNTREIDDDILGHAEINAIRLASKQLKRWNLSDCDLYVTLEPCSMCNEVIKQSRIKHVYYLLPKLSYKKEYNKTIFNHFQEKNTNISEQKYANILSDFFKTKRL